MNTPQHHSIERQGDNTLKLWNVDSSTDVMTYSGHTNCVMGVCVLNAKQFVSCSYDETLKLWNVDSSTAVMTYSGHTGAVRGVCVLNAKQFVSCSDDKTLKLWNV